jgi:hypothetical protein
MSDAVSVAALIISIIVGIPALVLSILNCFDTKRIRREFDSSLGTPAVEVRWGTPTESGLLSCRVTAQFNRVSTVRLIAGKEKKSVDRLARDEGKDLEFPAVPEGTEFKLSYIDPVAKQKYKREGVIRYEQADF